MFDQAGISRLSSFFYNLIVRNVGEVLSLKIVRLESARVPTEVIVLSDWAKSCEGTEFPLLRILVEGQPKKRDSMRLRIDGEEFKIPVYSQF